MPGSDHSRHRALAGVQSGGDGQPHLGLASRLSNGVVGGRVGHGVNGRAHRRHRRFYRCEQGLRVSAFLDETIPPGFTVAVAGKGREIVERIPALVASGRLSLLLAIPVRGGLCCRRSGGVRRGGAKGEIVRRRQVDETHRPLPRQGPTQSDPLGGKLCERIEARERRPFPCMDQQRHRRRHLRRSGEMRDALGFGRPLDQHHRRVEPVQRPRQAVRRAGSVVTDAEEVEALAHITSRIAL